MDISQQVKDEAQEQPLKTKFSTKVQRYGWKFRLKLYLY